MITHLEPDILECEVKWALGSITMNKASAGDGISAELFKILKDDGIYMLYSILSRGHRTGKGQFSFQFQRKAMPRMFRLPYNCAHFITDMVMLKILQAMFQQYVN